MAETISMPKLGFDMAEGLLVRWVKQVGETINKGDVLAEIETDKATVEVESSASGVVLQLIVDQGTMVPVNAPIAVVGAVGEVISGQLTVDGGQSKVESQKSADEKTAPQSAPTIAPVTQASAPLGTGPVKASPLAKKVARDQKVDLSNIKGTGPGGRIVRKDIEAALSSGQSSVSSVYPTQPITNYQFPITHEDKVVPTTKLRQAIGRRLVESKTTIPHFYVTHEFKMNALMDMRKQANAFLPDNEKVSVNDFILKGVALSLRQFPNLNATLKGTDIIQFGHVNVGVAVTVPGGLMTVVVKDTDQKTLRQISGEVKAMAGRAREGKVKPEDVDGSTFSTSNLGMYDVEEFIAIVNPPEAGILAISSAREVPVVENGELKVGWRMKATISVDHRISDGAEAAQFMQALAGFLENPVRMLV
ncbi:dihydrolipoamide acetyltransferase family protein [Candidatus Villigracilis saccharophilus]|uniref:dihydrolipoamide acetyltransferase family protein n=1 Tax=Candidatus Villigracilis saccharophilus TaxID=3140684 RepID=UPI003134CB2F|nr:2-oxo acid dehydrogenase subunit E2 [Anaerolineales bacterium]